ncbi:MAG: hypothetical protein ACYC2K_04610 [Gemmatimonadales bacterium]
MPTITVPPKRGSRHGSARLSEDFVVEIRRAAHQMGYYPIARMARANRVSYKTLRDALRGMTYSHVDRVAAPFQGPTSKAAGGCVVRLDSATTCGWQARYRGRSKYFSDSRYGKDAYREAKAWLHLQRNSAP